MLLNVISTSAYHGFSICIILLLLALAVSISFNVVESVYAASNQPPTNGTQSQPYIEFGKKAYLLGEKISVKVSDPQSNKDKASVDQLTAHVNTTSDNKGIDFILLETGKNTGIFVGNFTTRFGASSNLTSLILASPGDNGVISCCRGDIVRPFIDFSDIDKDDILDNWERFGIDSNQDGIIDFTLPCTPDTMNPSTQICPTPYRKDIFVEVDYMQNHQPNQNAINNVINAFSNAPVSCNFILCFPLSLSLNPPTGISLHVQVDNSQNIPEQNSLPIWTGFDNIKANNFGTSAERQDPNSANILAAKRLVYHYALFIHDQGTGGFPGASGISELPQLGDPFGANDFIVSLGGPSWPTDSTGHNVGSPDQQAATFMHELGHNLNLHHGGNDEINCKPNYVSVMSWHYQLPTFISRTVDYSHSVIPQLRENSLSDAAGIGTSTPAGLNTEYSTPTTNPAMPMIVPTPTGVSVDWNGNNNFGDTVSQNINNRPWWAGGGCDGGGNEVLNGYDDWRNLRYGFTNSPDAADGAHHYHNTTDITGDMVIKNRIAGINSLDKLIQDLPTSAFSDPTLIGKHKKEFHELIVARNDSIANLINSSNIENAVTKLEEIRAKMDFSIGGKSTDDTIDDYQVQRSLVRLIDGFTSNLKKDLEGLSSSTSN